jgi:hypothetical protein
MKFIKTPSFLKVIAELRKRYPKIDSDIDFFESNFFIEQ